MHTHKYNNKVYSSHYSHPVNQHWDIWHPHVLKPCAANPPEVGLVTHRAAVQVSLIEITKKSHATKQDKGICFPLVPIDVTAWWVASLVDTRPPGLHSTAG